LDHMASRAFEILDFRKPRIETNPKDERWGLRAELDRDLVGLQKALSISTSPTSKERHTEGVVLMALGRYAEAELALRKAYALPSDSASIHEELIASLSYQGKYVEAVEIGRRSVDQWPESEGSVVNLAVAL